MGAAKEQSGDVGGERPVQDESGRVSAIWSEVNLLSHAVPAARGGTVIVWSGWLGDDPWERDPRAWLPSSYDMLAKRLSAAREGLEATGTRWLIRPHARHVLNDPQRCVRFVAEFGGPTFGLALDPVSMLEPSMMEKAEDHVGRIVERLGGMADCVIMPEHGAAVTGGAGDDERVVFAGREAAVLSAEVVRRASGAWIGGKPVFRLG